MEWNADPVLFTLGPLTVKWYGLLFAMAFVFGTSIMTSIYRKEGKPEEDVSSLLIVMMVSTIVGARLGHCLFYEPGYYLSNPLQILFVWRGGLASHGGVLGITIGLWYYSKSRPSQPFLWLLDRMSIPAALAASFIRMGNLFNSEILGEPTSVPWAFTFLRIDEIPRHPVQLYESLTYLSIFFFLSWLYRQRKGAIRHGEFVGLLLMMVFSARFFLEFYKIQQASYSLPFDMSVGQFLSVPVVAIAFWVWRRSFSQGTETPNPRHNRRRQR